MDSIDVLFKKHSFNSRLLLEAMRKRGVALQPIRKTNFVQASYKGHKEVLYDIYTNLVPFTKGIIIDDKYSISADGLLYFF